MNRWYNRLLNRHQNDPVSICGLVWFIMLHNAFIMILLFSLFSLCWPTGGEIVDDLVRTLAGHWQPLLETDLDVSVYTTTQYATLSLFTQHCHSMLKIVSPSGLCIFHYFPFSLVELDFDENPEELSWTKVSLHLYVQSMKYYS